MTYNSAAIKNMIEILKDVSKHLHEGDTKLIDFSKSINASIKQLSKYDSMSKEITKKHNIWVKQSREGERIRKDLLKIESELSAQKSRQKLELDRQHEEGVQRNIRLRHSLQEFGTSFSKVTRILHGITPMGAVSMTGQKFGGLIGAQMRMSELQREINTLRLDKGLLDPNTDKDKIHLIEQTIKGKIQSLDQDKDSPAGKIIESNRHLKALVKRLEPVGEWAKKHSAGLVISAVSLGLLVGLLKSMLSVSPMLQKMLELFTMTFGLILRPFGDFLGFFLRPIAVMFLQSVIPFFKEAYPMLAELGTFLGETFVQFMQGKISVTEMLQMMFGGAFATISPWDVLNFIFDPFEEKGENTEGKVGLIGAGLAGLTAGAGVMTVKALHSIGKWGKNIAAGARGGGMWAQSQNIGLGKGTGSMGTGNTSIVSQYNKHIKGRPISANQFFGTSSSTGLVDDRWNIQKQMGQNWQKNIPKGLWSKLASIGKPALSKIPYAGYALMAATVGLAAFRMMDPEGYKRLSSDAESWGFFKDLIMPSEDDNVQNTMLGTGVDPLYGGHSNVQSSSSGSGDTYNDYSDNRVIVQGDVKKEVDAETLFAQIDEHSKRNWSNRR